MKPVAIFRHARTEGPGYLADFLDVRNIPWRLIRIDAGDPLPGSCHDFSGLAFMGGPMSVNDDLPWIPPVLALIRGAVAADIPVLGHCLGGQLMSKALGGVVTKNPVKELGWGKTEVADNATARKWFGDIRSFDSFHWHVKPSACRKIRCICFPARIARTRLLPSANIWPCNAMSK
jgi:GMP synthase-like glutamine amidotransferase